MSVIYHIPTLTYMTTELRWKPLHQSRKLSCTDDEHEAGPRDIIKEPEEVASIGR